MSLFGEDEVDPGEIALLKTKKIERVVEDLYKTVEQIRASLPEMQKALPDIEKQLAHLSGMLEGSRGVNVNVQSDNIKNLGVAEGGSKVEQANG